jgi:catechol 2,3-dioxygenase
VKPLLELAIRAYDLPKMVAFYLDVVGLTLYRDLSPEVVFLECAAGIEGHPQLFAIFDRAVCDETERKRLDHFAFGIDLADYDAELERLQGLGIATRLREFPNLGWRSIFFSDPEGNVVEFVSHDASVG